MLKALRNKKTAKKIWIILALIIVPAFVLWGSGSLRGDKREDVFVGRLFGKKVSAIEYKEALDAVKNQAVIRLGDSFEKAREYLNLEAQAWVRLALLYDARRRRITANDKEVIEAIENYPFFQRNGSFNNRLYTEMLQYVFHTQPRVFEEQVRQDLVIAKLYEAVTGQITLNNEEIKTEYQKANEELSLYYISGLPADFAKDITVTDDELKIYFDKNALDFKKPLSFNLSYFVSDNPETIKKAAVYLRKKDGIKKINRELGLSLKETGLFSSTGPIPQIGWSAQIVELAARLSPGQSLAPLELDKYYYIFQLKEKKEPYIPELTTVKDQVKETFIKNKSRELALAAIENCRSKLVQAYKENPRALDFDKAAREYGLKSGVTALFKYRSYIENIGSSDKFFETAKGLKGDAPSSIIELPTGYYIVRIKEVVAVDDKKFAAEKEEFAKKILLQKKQERFNEFVEELKKKT